MSILSNLSTQRVPYKSSPHQAAAMKSSTSADDFSNQRWSHHRADQCPNFMVSLEAHVIELDDGKIYRKALYLMVKTMVSCRFSLKPIHWIWFPLFISRGRSHPSTKPKPIPTLQAIAFSCGWSARSNPLSRWQDMGRSAVGVERIQRIARKKLWYGWILTYVSYVHINYQVWSGYNLLACINIIFGGWNSGEPVQKSDIGGRDASNGSGKWIHFGSLRQ